MLNLLTPYAMIAIPLAAIATAQTLKFLRFTYHHGLHWDYLFAPGHFPSAHSAFVSSLVVVIGYYQGIDTGAFAVASAFAFLTIYDAMRIRMQIGLNAKRLNVLVGHIKDIDPTDFPKLKERVGHYANEVFGGIIVGFGVSWVLIYILQ